jgi:Protein of unknown function (DUF2934)
MTATSASLEHRIHERAYSLWQRAGCPDGRDREFAERAPRQEDIGQPAPQPTRREGQKTGLIDQASSDSFPASDPPSISRITGPGRKTAGNP